LTLATCERHAQQNGQQSSFGCIDEYSHTNSFHLEVPEPDEPEVPPVPDVPELPDEPGEPIAPELPEVPDVPLLPDV
jgi:hypothetical protein